MANLTGCAVLVVEDEYLIASYLLSELERVGASVLGSVASVENASALSSSGAVVFVAVLDLNLQGRSGLEVADCLLENQIPFIIQTGYQCDNLPDRFLGVPCLGKPCDERELLDLLSSLLPAGPGPLLERH